MGRTNRPRDGQLQKENKILFGGGNEGEAQIWGSPPPSVGKRAFPVSGANFWNSLPSHVTCAPSLAIFRQRLKTFLFHLSYPDLIL